MKAGTTILGIEAALSMRWAWFWLCLRPTSQRTNPISENALQKWKAANTSSILETFETRTHIKGCSERIREKFNKPDGYYIEVYRLPCEDHGGRYELTPDIYLGLYDDVNDLLDHCVIDKKTLRDIIPSNETRICSID